MVFLGFFLLNIFAYLVMCFDKIQAIRSWRRIPEKTLWMLGLLGGAVGIFFGMQAPLYHKAGKGRFVFWVPVLVLFWFIVWIFLAK